VDPVTPMHPHEGPPQIHSIVSSRLTSRRREACPIPPSFGVRRGRHSKGHREVFHALIGNALSSETLPNAAGPRWVVSPTHREPAVNRPASPG
jgi:hypothetical protein